MTIFDDWRNGLISGADACRALCHDLGEVESQIAPLEQERAMLREQISYILDKLGGKASVPGFGSLELTAPAVVRGYDKKRLDALLIDLAAEAPEIVARLAQCRTENARAGALRITRER